MCPIYPVVNFFREGQWVRGVLLTSVRKQVRQEDEKSHVELPPPGLHFIFARDGCTRMSKTVKITPAVISSRCSSSTEYPGSNTSRSQKYHATSDTPIIATKLDDLFVWLLFFRSPSVDSLAVYDGESEWAELAGETVWGTCVFLVAYFPI